MDAGIDGQVCILKSLVSGLGIELRTPMINLTINNLFLGRFQLETAVRIAQRLSDMFPGITAIFEKVTIDNRKEVC
jgi:hypothetical protein